MDYFTRLPFEVLLKLFSWIRPKDIISLSRTCRIFRNTVSVLDDKLWAQVCCNEFSIRLTPSENGFARRFYKNVLHQYGHLLGFWTKLVTVNGIDKDRFGSLVKILYRDGQLLGFDLHPPKVPHLMQPIRPKLIFTISMDQCNNDSVKVNCCIDPENPHHCELDDTPSPPTSRQYYQLTRRCSTTEFHVEYNSKWNMDLAYNHLFEHVDTMAVSSCAIERLTNHFLEKRVAARHTAYLAHYSRFELPSPSINPEMILPIQPGIFKGTTKSNGIQLFLLSYKDGNKVTGRKITGDADIPAGRVAFEADLSCCMYLNQEMQSNMHRISEIEASNCLGVMGWNDLPQPQPFLILQDCGKQVITNLPNECLARFHGVGTFSCMNGGYFEKPYFLKGHWIVFNQDLFGFLWIINGQFGDLSLYHRVEDPLVPFI